MPKKTLAENLYTEFRDFLERQCGIILGENKQYLVKSRLAPLMSRFDLSSLTEVIKRVLSSRDRNLRTAVIDAMTTNETLWFRDTYPYELLKKRIYPEFVKHRGPVKIWSAACSSGQEPYSISMTSIEYQSSNPGALPGGVKILGTDISNTMLEHSKSAEYDPLMLGRGLSLERKRMFFEAAGDNMRLVKKVRDQVSFRHCNLLESYSLLGKFDIIFCRNVLIYFSADVKTKILNQFATVLNPGGYLFLGASESLTGLSDRYEMIRCNPGIVYQVKK